jgi:hypothetical protein
MWFHSVSVPVPDPSIQFPGLKIREKKIAVRRLIRQHLRLLAQPPLIVQDCHIQDGSSQVTQEPISSVSAKPGIMAWVSERLLVIHQQGPSEETHQISTPPAMQTCISTRRVA